MIQFPWSISIHSCLLSLIMNCITKPEEKKIRIQGHFSFIVKASRSRQNFFQDYINNYSIHINNCGSLTGSLQRKWKLLLARTICFFQGTT